MMPKERILATLARKPVDRTPVDLWHTPEIAATLRHHCGVADDLAMWEALGLDKIVWVFIHYKTSEGYICCSCHNTQPGTPLENILAMVDEVRSSGLPEER